MRTLRASRYLTGRNEWLKKFIIEELHYLDFDECIAFYNWFRTQPLENEDVALLAANDRFFLLAAMLGRKDVLHPWIYDRCREVEESPDGHLDLWSRYHYKMLALDTPVPTPNGFVNHGDLKVGDIVYGSDGKPTRVKAVSPVYTGKECFVVRFDKGQEIVAGAEHLWAVDLAYKARLQGNSRTKTRTSVINTTELKAEVDRSLATPNRVLPSIPVASALHGQNQDLLVDPYVLGAWLGDGDRKSGRITGIDREIWDRLADAYDLSHNHAGADRAETRTLYKLQPRLKALGVFDNKHIPPQYLKGSIDQRVQLLRGLMDTDGHIDQRNTATFVNQAETLVDNVFDLCVSLGLKPSKRRYRGKEKPYWQVSFQATLDLNPFHLARKANRVKPVSWKTRSTRHAVVSVEPTASVPCNCIQVEAQDGLYLAGRHAIPTHNTSIITFAGIIQEIVCDPEITVAIFSATRRIALKFFNQIKEELQTNQRLVNVFADVFWLEPKKEAPRWSEQTGLVVKRRSNPKEATLECFGLIEGMPTGSHFKLLVYDDLVTIELVSNSDMIAKVTERWELSDNLGVGEGTRKWHAGTRYDFADTYGTLLERKVLKPRIYPATDNGLLDGKPVLLSQAEWEKVKLNQPGTVGAQMLQNPVAGKASTFNMDWLKGHEIIPATLNVYIVGDPSKGRSADSDQTAIAVIAVDSAGNRYLVDGACHHMRLDQRWQTLKNLHAKWDNLPGVQAVHVGWEQYGLVTDIEHFEDQMQRAPKHRFPIRELNWVREGNQSKEHRVQRLQPDFLQGRFYLPAAVWHEVNGGGGPSIWAINKDDAKIEYRPLLGDTKAQRGMKASGQAWRVQDPILCKDEDGNLYDLTRRFIDQYLFFPRSKRKDLIDAVSRFYDMEPLPPAAYERHVETEPVYFPDA